MNVMDVRSKVQVFNGLMACGMSLVLMKLKSSVLLLCLRCEEVKSSPKIKYL